MAIEITYDEEGSTFTLDESLGLQNSESPDDGDKDDEDIARADIAGTAFEALLFDANSLNLSSAYPDAGRIARSPSDFINLTSDTTITSITLAGLDDSGAEDTVIGLVAYDGTNFASGAATGPSGSDLQTVDGEDIRLFSDVLIDPDGAGGNDPFLAIAENPDATIQALAGSVVFGVDENGEIAFVILMEKTKNGDTDYDLGFTHVTFQALAHPDPTLADEPIDLGDFLQLSVGEASGFSFVGTPPGKSNFLMAPAQSGDGGLLITSTTNVVEINTSNASEFGATIGWGSQGINAGETVVFSFVGSGLVDDFTIRPKEFAERLDQKEADDPANIVFDALAGQTGANFTIAQTVGNATQALTIAAFDQGPLESQNQGDGTFYQGLGDDVGVDITSVTITRAGFDPVTFTPGGPDPSPNFDVSVTFHTIDPDMTPNNGDEYVVAEISGVDEGDVVAYTTAAQHHRVWVTGVSGNFDVGVFEVSSTDTSTASIGEAFVVDDAAPTAAITVTGQTVVHDESAGLQNDPLKVTLIDDDADLTGTEDLADLFAGIGDGDELLIDDVVAFTYDSAGTKTVNDLLTALGGAGAIESGDLVLTGPSGSTAEITLGGDIATEFSLSGTHSNTANDSDDPEDNNDDDQPKANLSAEFLQLDTDDAEDLAAKLIGWAESFGPVVTGGDTVFDADGPASADSAVWSLDVGVDGNGDPLTDVDSGLTTLVDGESKKILLNVETLLDGTKIVVGRVDLDDDGGVAGDPVGVALSLTQQGHLRLAQYVAVEHFNDAADDEKAVFADDTLFAVLTATDSEGDSHTVRTDISSAAAIEDDAPIGGGASPFDVEEDHIDNSQSTGNNEDTDEDGNDTPGNVNDDGPFRDADGNATTGTDPIDLKFALGINVGTDADAIFSLSSAQDDLNALATANMGLSSNGDLIEWEVSGDETNGWVLTGYVDVDATGAMTGSFDDGIDREVIRWTVSSDGMASFRLLDQVDNLVNVTARDAPGDKAGENLQSVFLGAVLKVTDAEGGDPVDLGNNPVTYNIIDDVPENNDATVSLSVQEDALNNFDSGFDPATDADHIEGSTGNPDNGDTTVATITVEQLATLVDVGADEPASFSLNLATPPAAGAISGTAVTRASNDDNPGTTLTSRGDPVFFFVVGSTILGVTTDDDAAPAVEADIERIVFRISAIDDDSDTMGATEAFQFELLDQIDNDNDNDLTTGHGDADVDIIDIAGAFIASDSDDDELVLDNGLRVSIENDVPVNNSATFTKTVHEDALPTGNKTGEGSKTVTATITYENLVSLIDVGADEPVGIALVSGGDDEITGTEVQRTGDGDHSGGTTLTSQGATVYWFVDKDDILEGGAGVVYGITVNGDPDFAPLAVGDIDRVIFSIAPDGDDFEFMLLDQIDNVASVSGNEPGDADLDRIDVAAAFIGTDTDGDSLVLAGGAYVDIENDVPVNNSEDFTKTVHEDALPTGNSTGEAGTTVTATITHADLLSLVDVGADEPVSTALVSGDADEITGTAVQRTGDGDHSGVTTLTSKGANVYWFVDKDNILAGGAGVVYGITVNGSPNFGSLTVGDVDRVIFSIAPIASTDNFQFMLRDQIDNVASALNIQPGDSDTDQIDVAPAFLATDKDGDSLVLAGGAWVDIQNDVPDLTVQNLVGTGTTNPQIGLWNPTIGADEDGTLSLSLDNYFIGDSALAGMGEVNVGDAMISNGNVTFHVTITDEDLPENFGFNLTFRPDGTYVVDLDGDGFGSSVTVSSEDGSLDAGGPDPVRTLTIPVPDQPSQEIVFFGVDPVGLPAGFHSQAISDSNTDDTPNHVTEGELEAAPVPDFLSPADMNVSTAGIGLGNNNLNGNEFSGIDGADGKKGFDESFVINPVNSVTMMKVFIDNSVGGYDTGSEELYYTVYLEDGSTPVVNHLVGDADLTMEPGGQVSFLIEWDGSNLIDAVQLTMGTGTIKIPVIEFTFPESNVVPPVYMDLTATLTDTDTDSVSHSFWVDLAADDDPLTEPDFELTDHEVRVLDPSDDQADVFNVDLADPANQWVITDGFDSGTDTIVLLDPAAGISLDTDNAGDDIITVGAKTVTIENGAEEILGSDILIEVGGILVSGDFLLDSDGNMNDSFVFTAPGEGPETISGFDPLTDQIVVSADGFGGVLAAGALPSDAFEPGTAADDGNDRFIYDSATGELFYDDDGNGPNAQQLITTLDSGLGAFDQDNILVIG